MKLFATDLDGTLLNSSHTISGENRAALTKARENGYQIAIVTGRSYSDAKAICNEAAVNAHIISNNGAFAFLESGERIYAEVIDRRHIDATVEWLQTEDYYFDMSTHQNIYIPHDAEAVLERDYLRAKAADPALAPEALAAMIDLLNSQEGLVRLKSFKDLPPEEYSNILGVSFAPDKLLAGREYMTRQSHFTLVVSHRYNFEVVSSRTSKGNALSHLANHLAVDRKNIIAIGDNYNDLSMLQLAGTSIAMGNAEEEVKRCCQHVTITNDNHGVAHILHKLLA